MIRLIIDTRDTGTNLFTVAPMSSAVAYGKIKPKRRNVVRLPSYFSRASVERHWRAKSREKLVARRTSMYLTESFDTRPANELSKGALRALRAQARQSESEGVSDWDGEWDKGDETVAVTNDEPQAAQANNHPNSYSEPIAPLWQTYAYPGNCSSRFADLRPIHVPPTPSRFLHL